MLLPDIRHACRRLEAAPYYRQLTRSQGPLRLWPRLVWMASIVATAVAVALVLRWHLPDAYQPDTLRLMRRVGGWALLLSPSLAGLIAAWRTHTETTRQSFILVGLATMPPASLVDALAGAALHIMWPLWVTTSTLTGLLGVTLTAAIEPGLFLVAVVGAFSGLLVMLHGAAVWFGVWAGVTAGLKRQGLGRTLLGSAFDANANAFLSLIVGLMVGGLAALVFYGLAFPAATLALNLFGAPAGWVTTAGNVLALAAIMVGAGIFVRMMRAIFDGVRLRAVLVMEGRV